MQGIIPNYFYKFMQLKVELELIITAPIKDTKDIWAELMEKIFKQVKNEAKNRSHFLG